MQLSLAMNDFLQYFGAMGPRWGLSEDVCRMHALLYICDQPLSLHEISVLLGITEPAAAQTLTELTAWDMVAETSAGWDAKRDPWDMMLSALQQRTAREVQPAIDALLACQNKAKTDGTPLAVMGHFKNLTIMFNDLAAISRQSRRLSPAALARLIKFGGHASRLMSRF